MGQFLLAALGFGLLGITVVDNQSSANDACTLIF